MIVAIILPIILVIIIIGVIVWFYTTKKSNQHNNLNSNEKYKHIEEDPDTGELQLLDKFYGSEEYNELSDLEYDFLKTNLNDFNDINLAKIFLDNSEISDLEEESLTDFINEKTLKYVNDEILLDDYRMGIKTYLYLSNFINHNEFVYHVKEDENTTKVNSNKVVDSTPLDSNSKEIELLDLNVNKSNIVNPSLDKSEVALNNFIKQKQKNKASQEIKIHQESIDDENLLFLNDISFLNHLKYLENNLGSLFEED